MIDIIRQKLKQYNATNDIERENAIKEILQEIALYGLWRADFFNEALFQGGTSLRILHRLNRFSEDLDFILKQPNDKFDWSPYLKTLKNVLAEFGLNLEVQPNENMDAAIRQAIIKDNAIVNQLNLTFGNSRQSKAIKIKLEIDTNPPAYSGEASSFLDFPADYEVRHQDLASNFALKIHALLCRPYLKGRDWYDFSWYVAKDTIPNLKYLKAALEQSGPWSDNGNINIDINWLKQNLETKIQSIDWESAKKDVQRFIKQEELKSLELWSDRFFLSKLAKMVKYSN